MRSSLRACLLVCFLGRTSLVWAWNEPAGFRDVPWGTPLVQVQERLPSLRCAQKCDGDLMIGQVRVFVSIYSETQRGMDTVDMSFPADSFYQIEVAFLERYGTPSLRKREMVQNRMGAQFVNQILQWSGQRVLIKLEKYGIDLNTSFAELQTTEARRAGIKHIQDKAKKGKGDL